MHEMLYTLRACVGMRLILKPGIVRTMPNVLHLRQFTSVCRWLEHKLIRVFDDHISATLLIIIIQHFIDATSGFFACVCA